MKYAVISLCCALFIAASAAAADVAPVNKDFKVIDCGTPIELLKVYASTVYRHPDTRKLHLLVEYGHNNGYGIGEEEWGDVDHRLVDIELETGLMRRARASDGVTSSHYLHPDGNIYLFEGKTHPDSLSMYDTRTGKYEPLFKRSAGAYKVCLAPSGTFYCGQVGGDVISYNPATQLFKQYRKPSGQWAFWGVYTMEVEEPYVYCGMTDQGKWWLTVIDTRDGGTENFFKDPPQNKGGVVRTENGNIFFGRYPLKDGKPLMDDEGKPLPLDPPDNSPRLPGNRSWPDMWRVSGYAGRQFGEAEQIGLEFDMADAEPNNWNGGVSTIRWRKKGEEDWRQIIVKGLPLIGASAKCLGVGPDGKLYGVATHYGSVFRFDPIKGVSERIGNAPGSVYQILPLEKACYFCGYVAYVAEWEYDKPYDTVRTRGFDEDTNPKRYRTHGKWTDQMIVGPDGKIYAGGRYGRHKPGGGLNVFDPATKKMLALHEPWFKEQAPRALCFVDGGETLVVATTQIGRDLKPDAGRIFLFDVAKQEIVKEIKLELPVDPEQLFVAGDGALIGVSRLDEKDEYGVPLYHTLVYGVDLATGKPTFEKKYPGRAFTGVSRYDRSDLVRGPDGCGWLFVGEALCRIHPDGTLETIRDEMKYRGRMIWQGKTLYVYNGGRVYCNRFANVIRIPDILK